MKCKKCEKEILYEVGEVTISIRDATRDVTVKIVPDDICLDCLLKALEIK